MEPSSTKAKVAEVVPKRTELTPVKPLPEIVTALPGRPELGDRPVIDGAFQVKRSNLPVADEPASLVSTMLTAPAPVGAGAVMVALESEPTVTGTDWPPIVAPVTPLRLLPLMVTEVPATPFAGDTPVRFGP